MRSVVIPLLIGLSVSLRSRVEMQAEIAALHHQLRILQRRTGARPRLRSIDRILWTWLSRLWSGWRRALVIVKPETVLAWHRRGFQLYGRWKSRKRGPGRPKASRDLRALIRKMSLSNPGWGAPRIHGELLKLGIDIGQTSVGQYMVRCRRPPSQTWRTFLDNHLRQLVAVDFFVVPTLTFRVLFVFVVLAHDRRRILHFNVTSHPTAEWTAQQIREAFLFIQEIAQRYEKAAKITLVMDNLNTHGPGSLYETLVPGEAKALWDRFEFVYTPKHGSWLNMAEIELNVLAGQWLKERIDNRDELASKVAQWQTHRNNRNSTINWQFTTEKARTKLRRLYPTIEM